MKEKVKSGVNAIQIFDSWGGILSPEDYNIYSWPYILQIVKAIKDEIPTIIFGKGCWFALHEMKSSGAAALGGRLDLFSEKRSLSIWRPNHSARKL